MREVTGCEIMRGVVMRNEDCVCFTLRYQNCLT